MIRSVPMKRPALVLPMVFVLAGCTVAARNIDHVQAGMNRNQVRPIMGQPDTVAYSPGKECAYYSLLKDFWSRVPWSVSERYYVCYDEGKVESFGKVDAAPSG
jgi:SmpA / OmlA family